MRIGGLQKFSMSDFPGKLSAIIFTTGCNFRCPYCHNPELVLPEKFAMAINLGEVFSFLKQRVGKLDGVVFSGGEPTLHEDLPDIIRSIKKLGFAVKLDTNGTNPEMLYNLMQEELVDYVAMDYKAPAEKYSLVTGRPEKYGNFIDKVQESLVLLITSNIDYEIRTTVAGQLLDEDDIQEIRSELGDVKKHYLQKFEPGKTLDPNFGKLPSKSSSSELVLEDLAKDMKNVFVR